MSIKPNFSIQDIIKKNREVYNHIFNTILDTLERTLMNVVEKARSGAYATDPDHEYMDRSGHLRQSVGYVIYHSGEMLRSSFFVWNRRRACRTGICANESIRGSS